MTFGFNHIKVTGYLWRSVAGGNQMEPLQKGVGKRDNVFKVLPLPPQQAAPPPQPESCLGVSGAGEGHPPQAEDQSSRRLWPGRSALGHGQAFSARGGHGTRKPADTKRFSCCCSQRWKLYRNTAETTRTRVYKTLFRPVPLPHDG